jgi:hypothetical protein
MGEAIAGQPTMRAISASIAARSVEVKAIGEKIYPE